MPKKKLSDASQTMIKEYVKSIENKSPLKLIPWTLLRTREEAIKID